MGNLDFIPGPWFQPNTATAVIKQVDYPTDGINQPLSSLSRSKQTFLVFIQSAEIEWQLE